MGTSINGIHAEDSTRNFTRHQDISVGVQKYFNAHKPELNHAGIFIPVMSAMIKTLNVLGASDPKTLQQGQFEKSLKRILDDNSDIEQDFGEIKEATTDEQKQAAASKAIDSYNDISQAFQEAGVPLNSETKDKINKAYGFGAKASSGVFQGTEDKASLAKAWDKMSHIDSPSKGDGPAVTNPLQGIGNTINNSSAAAQSTLN